MQPELIIIGGGGHALSVAACAQECGLKLLGFTDPQTDAESVPGLPLLGDDSVLTAFEPGQIALLNGLGSIGRGQAPRTQVFERLRQQGFDFASLRHPTATVSSVAVELGHGVQLMAASLINTHVQVGDNVLINSGAIVEHGCTIGAHSHIASGAVVCGDVRIGNGVHIGAGATLVQGIEIGDGAVIAAGSVVTANVEALTLVAGVPGVVKRRIAL